MSSDLITLMSLVDYVAQGFKDTSVGLMAILEQEKGTEMWFQGNIESYLRQRNENLSHQG